MNILMYFETARISSAESLSANPFMSRSAPFLTTTRIESSDRPAKKAASVKFGFFLYFFSRFRFYRILAAVGPAPATALARIRNRRRH